MWTTHVVMAELWHKKQSGTATQEDIKELEMCLEANMNMVWKFVVLENKSLAASVVGDDDWQHDICAKIDDLTEKVYGG